MGLLSLHKDTIHLPLPLPEAGDSAWGLMIHVTDDGKEIPAMQAGIFVEEEECGKVALAFYGDTGLYAFETRDVLPMCGHGAAKHISEVPYFHNSGIMAGGQHSCIYATSEKGGVRCIIYTCNPCYCSKHDTLHDTTIGVAPFAVQVE